MLVRRVCRLSTRQPASPFLRTVSPDHITATANDRKDQSEEYDRVNVLMEELARERKFIKSLREENETLRNSLTTLEQREQELSQLSDHSRSLTVDLESYKRKFLESENTINELKIQLKDFKDAMEIERVKLNQARSLPIILAGIAGCAGTYLLVRSKIELEKQQFKFLKFELENMWMTRVREVDARLDKQIEENERLATELGKVLSVSQSHVVSIWGRKIF
jgi:hypothetical protein